MDTGSQCGVREDVTICQRISQSSRLKSNWRTPKFLSKDAMSINPSSRVMFKLSLWSLSMHSFVRRVYGTHSQNERVDSQMPIPSKTHTLQLNGEKFLLHEDVSNLQMQ